jgi:hypothetical protein
VFPVGRDGEEHVGTASEFGDLGFVSFFSRASSFLLKPDIQAGRTLMLSFHSSSLRSRHSSAHSRYRVLSSHFAAYRWPLLEAFHLAKSLRTHAAIEAPRDAIWIGEALTFLKSVVAVRGAGKDGKRESGSIFAEEVEEDLKELVSGLVDGLRITGRELSRGQSFSPFPYLVNTRETHPSWGSLRFLSPEHAIHDHPAFSVRPLSKRAQLTTEEDGSTISFEVTSRLPCVRPKSLSHSSRPPRSLEQKLRPQSLVLPSRL